MRDHSVLVVEESSVVSDLIRDLLEASGFSVVQASTSKDALALFKERSFGVVVADAKMSKINGYQIRDEIRGGVEAPDTPVLLMVTEESLSRSGQSSRLGTQDTIQKPIDPVDLIVRVRAAVGEVPTFGPVQSLSIVPEPPKEPVPEIKLSKSGTPGTVITVFSLKGGVGTSTIAVNLAVALRRQWNDSTALVDLSLESGVLNILLDILPTSTLDELVAENGRMSTEVVSQYLMSHKSGVCLLSAPPSPERAELVDGASLRKALSFLSDGFDYVVIDTASTFAEHTLMALEMADHILLPLIGDISSIRAATTALDIFQALSIPDDKVILVFNELFPRVGLSRKHAEASLHLPTHAIPFGGSKLLDSVNLGTPIVMSDPDSPFSTAIGTLASQVSRSDSGTKVPAKSPDLMSKFRKRLGA